MSHRERVIILRKVKYGESDLIIQCLTPQGARASYLARGALRSRKRFGGGVLEPTHYVEVQAKTAAANSSHLVALDEATILDDFAELRKDYDRLELGLFMVETISKISREGDQHSENLFNLLGHGLKMAETNANLPRLKLHFILKLLRFEGVLTVEDWMRPPLALPLTETDKWEAASSEIKMHLSSLTMGLAHYIKSAEPL